MASITSDLREHPDTIGHPGVTLMMLEAMGGFLRTDADVRRAITGFH